MVADTAVAVNPNDERYEEKIGRMLMLPIIGREIPVVADDAVKPEFASLIQAHASYLAQNRNRKIRLEGHADERGSREYNMALGQRRASAVRQATTILGVGNERIESISFGEDKPRANGHDEASWAQNRRVEIVYDGE